MKLHPASGGLFERGAPILVLRVTSGPDATGVHSGRARFALKPSLPYDPSGRHRQGAGGMVRWLRYDIAAANGAR